MVKQGHRIRMIRIFTIPGPDGEDFWRSNWAGTGYNDKNINPTWTGQGGLLAVKLDRNKKKMIRILTLPGRDREVSWRSNWTGTRNK